MTDIIELICRTDDEANTKLQEKILFQPYKYLRQVPSKGVFANIVKSFNYWFKVHDEIFTEFTELAVLIHETSLIIDDVEDSFVCRRGLPAAHLVYGEAQVINSGIYALLYALEKLLKLGNAEAANIYVDQMLNLHRGQGMDIYYRDNFICPTEEEYCEIIKSKTSCLLHVKFLQLFSENKSDFTKMADLFTLYFQICNDYWNLCDKTYADSKIYCDDITEGKFSFPIIHAIRSEQGVSQVMSILRTRTTDNALKKHCVALMEKCGSFKYTREVLTRLDKELREEIQRLGGNPLFEMFLDKLLTWKE